METNKKVKDAFMRARTHIHTVSSKKMYVKANNNNQHPNKVREKERTHIHKKQECNYVNEVLLFNQDILKCNPLKFH